MCHEMERTIIYAPRSYLFGAGVIFIVLAILALAVGWLRRRGSEFFVRALRGSSDGAGFRLVVVIVIVLAIAVAVAGADGTVVTSRDEPQLLDQ
jgi:hypothetical protein